MTRDNGLSGLRRVTPLPMAGVTPNAVPPERPEVRWVAPATLLIEDSYQRDLSRKSMELIRSIVTRWDWASMKPPICAETEHGDLVIIDGQHTAIGAASHPDVVEIPILVVQLAAVEARAGAFVRHNSDRVNITRMQVHYAALTAGDEVAVAMAQACERSGATILRNAPATSSYNVGETVAVGAIRAMTEKRGVVFMARVLRVLVDAKRAPLTAVEIAAVSALLTEAEWKDAFTDEALALVVRSKSMVDWEGWAESKVRKGMKMPMWRAIAIAWFQNAPKRRRAS